MASEIEPFYVNRLSAFLPQTHNQNLSNVNTNVVNLGANRTKNVKIYFDCKNSYIVVYLI